MTPTTSTDSPTLTDGVLEAISSTAMRTAAMEGAFPSAPVVGQSFIHYGKPLTPGTAIRIVRTTPVVEISVVDGVWEFQTENSRYRLRILQPN